MATPDLSVRRSRRPKRSEAPSLVYTQPAYFVVGSISFKWNYQCLLPLVRSTMEQEHQQAAVAALGISVSIWRGRSVGWRTVTDTQLILV